LTKKLLGSLELNRIYQRDCIEGLRLLPDESIDLVIADPPYGIDFNSNWSKDKEYRSKVKTVNGIQNDGKDNNDFLAEVLFEINRVLKPNSHVYWFTRWDRIMLQQPLIERHFKLKNALVWMKNNWSMGDLTGAYAGQYESILFAQKGRRSLNEVDGKRRHTDVMQFDRVPASKLRHSHEKPEDLIEFLIRKSSNEGEIVLDPFCGSGTTAVCARRLSRDFVTFELESEFIEIANKRIDSL
jgi:site-specific DNA-methyltransferase (adenine-specific)